MKDESRLATNTLLSFAAQGVTAVVGILLVPFLLTNLGEESYGVIGVIASILAFANLIDLGIMPANVRQFTRFLFGGEVQRSNELASSAMAIFLVLALLALAAAWIGREPLLALFRVDPALWRDANRALLLIALFLGFRLISTPYRAALISQLRHDVVHYTRLISEPLRAGVIVVGFMLWEPTLVLWALGWLAAATTAFLIMRFQAYRQCPSLEVKGRLVARRGIRDLAGFGVYTSVAQFSQRLSHSSGALVISYFLGTAAVARFTPALTIVLVLQSLSAAFLVQLNPVVTKAHARSDTALIRSVLIRSTRYSLLLSGGAAVGVGTLAFVLIPVWLGEDFRDTAIVLMIWCVATLLHSGVGGALQIFLGTGRLRVIAMMDGALAVAGVAASVYFVGFTEFGIVGVTFGVVLAQFVRTAVYVVYAMGISGVVLSQYFRESCLGPMLCLALTAATSIGTQLALAADERVEFAAAGGLSLLVFGALAWTVGFNAQDRGKALGFLRKLAEWATELIAGRAR